MADTVFGKIVRGEIPCNKVYEDEQVLAFLDINPLSAGHMLVVPKEPAETLDRLSDESAAALGRVLPRLCRDPDAAPRQAQEIDPAIFLARAAAASRSSAFAGQPIPSPSREFGFGMM